METMKTPKGTTLPLINLKGKPYLQVAHRLVWVNEDSPNFEMVTDVLLLTDEQTVVKASIYIKDASGNVVRSAMATKRETKKDFSDHTEKAETGALGRALAMLGYGTQFCMADLDEGNRLADSPVTPAVKSTATPYVAPAARVDAAPVVVATSTASVASSSGDATVTTKEVPTVNTVEEPKRNAFKKPNKPPVVQNTDGF